jgi:hypothetical protein
MGVPLSLWVQRWPCCAPLRAIGDLHGLGQGSPRVEAGPGSFAGTWVPLHAKSLDFYRHCLALSIGRLSPMSRDWATIESCLGLGSA